MSAGAVSAHMCKCMQVAAMGTPNIGDRAAAQPTLDACGITDLDSGVLVMGGAKQLQLNLSAQGLSNKDGLPLT